MAQATSLTGLSIGALARETGVSVRSIRHYDEHGLLTSARASNGYRTFPPTTVQQVKQIQRLIATGFNRADVKAGLETGEGVHNRAMAKFIS